MPEGAPRSKYAVKRRNGPLPGPRNTRSRFRCERCRNALSGKRCHGFLTYEGRARVCGLCAKTLGLIR